MIRLDEEQTAHAAAILFYVRAHPHLSKSSFSIRLYDFCNLEEHITAFCNKHRDESNTLRRIDDESLQSLIDYYYKRKLLSLETSLCQALSCIHYVCACDPEVKSFVLNELLPWKSTQSTQSTSESVTSHTPAYSLYTPVRENSNSTALTVLQNLSKMSPKA